MKKLFLFMMPLLSVAAVSCVGESEYAMSENKGTELTFVASIENEYDSSQEETRTTLEITDNTAAVKWARKDKISILNSLDKFDEFTLSSGSGTTVAEFTGTLTQGATAKDIAVYPAGNHSYQGSTLTVSLPSSYGSRSVAYSGNTNAIMMAEADGNSLPFRHLGGLVCFTIVHVPAGTNEVSLTGRGICGDFVVTDGIISKPEDAAYNTVSHVFSDFVPAEGTKNRRTFYFPLPVGSYDKFTVNIIGDDAIRTSTITFGGPKTLSRADFVKFPDLDADNLPVSNIDKSAFSLLNLDYPGLDEVKDTYESGNFNLAASQLLEYYRNREGVKNISVSDVPSYSATDLNRADQATREGGFRFYVKNFVENTNGTSSDESDDIYYSFLGDGSGPDWTLVPDAVSGNQEWKQRYRMQWMLSQAKVYAVTKDEKYVKAWKEIMTSFMSVCNNYKDENGFVTYRQPNLEPYNVAWAALQVTARLESLLTVFEYYKNSENFTSEWLLALLGYIYDHVGSMLANPYDSGAVYSNITTAQHACKVLAGLYMPEFKDAPSWLAAGASALVNDVGRQFNSDGVLGEFDYGYHVGTLSDYIGVYNAVQANIRYNSGLNNLFPPDYTSRLRNAAGFVQDYIYPDYTVEGMSDTRPAGVASSSILSNLKAYNEMFPDGHFEYMSDRNHTSGTAPSADLCIYPVSGYYMFRSGWDEDDIMLIHKNNNDTEQRFHNQWDNGTVSLYCKGRRFMPDASVPSYGGSPELDALRDEYAATAKHSTISVDGNTHVNRAGRYLGSGKTGNYEYVVTENEFDTSLFHRRAIFFVNKEFFVIADDVHGTKGSVDIVLKMMLGDGRVGVEYVCPDGNGVTPFTVYSNYQDNNNMYFKTFVPDRSRLISEKTKTASDYYVNNVVTLADYDSEKIERASYQVALEKSGDAETSVRFITVICPIGSGSEGESLDIEAGFADGGYDAGGASFIVEISGTAYGLSYEL